MSSHLEQIQSLIADIEGVLQQPSPRLPWMGETARDSRRVLERIRTYLQEQQKLAEDEPPPPTSTRPTLPTEDVESDSAGRSSEPYDSAEPSSAGQMLQLVVREMGALRSNLMQPLLSDMESLQRERDALLKEIRQLEAQRQHQHSLAQQSAYQQQIIAEFLQTLMGRVQESLTAQVTQTLANLEGQFLSESTSNFAQPPLEGREAEPSGAYVPIWDPSDAYGSGSSQTRHRSDRLLTLQMLQERLDRTIGTLDSTIDIVFEALLRNVHGYEESLSQGLDRMHSLGQQGEMMFSQLVSHLAQKLGQEAAGLLQSSVHPAGLMEPAAQPAEPIAASPTEPPLRAQQPPSTGTAKRPTDAEKARQKKDSPPAASRPADREKLAKNRNRAQNVEAQTLSENNRVSTTAEAEARIDILMNQQAQPLSEAPPKSAKSPLSSPTATPTPAEELDGILELLDTELPNSQAAGTSSSSAFEWNAIQTNPSNESGLDALYSSLFGLEEATSQVDEQTNGIQELQQNSESLKSRNAGAIAPEQNGLNRFEEALFEGFADPAIPSEEKLPLNEAAQPAAQSLEEFLFTENSAVAENDSLTLANLFDQTPEKPSIAPPQKTSDSTSATPSSTQAASEESLTDLFGEPETIVDAETAGKERLRLLPQKLSEETPATKVPEPISVQPKSQEPNLTILTEEWAEDSYVPASPDEVLLPTSEQETEEESTFSLNTSTLQQLRQDLSALEGFEDWNEPARAQQLSADAYARAQDLPLDSTLAPNAIAPIPESAPSSVSSEDWESLTFSDWAVDVGADSTENPPTQPEQAEATQTAEQEDSADDWLTEISESAEALPQTRNSSELPPVAMPQRLARDAYDTQSMTLDEAFASLNSAMPQTEPSPHARPERIEDEGEVELFHSSSQFSNPTLAEVPTNEGNSSILDDLFASMSGETLPADEEFEPDSDAFSPSENSISSKPVASSSLDDLLAGIWSEPPMPDNKFVAEPDLVQLPDENPNPSAMPNRLPRDVSAQSQSDDLAFSNLDELLAGIWSEVPTSEDSSPNSDLFFTENDTGSVTQPPPNSAPPSANPARKDLRTGEKKKKPLNNKTERIVDVSAVSVTPQSPRAESASAENVGLSSNPQRDSSYALAESQRLDLIENRDRIWYLGIDFGTTGVSAVLSNRQSGEFYPIYWVEVQGSESGNPSARSFRIPAIAYRSPDTVRWSAATHKGQSPDSAGWFLLDFKPYLKVGITGTKDAPDDGDDSTPKLWDAMLQWGDRQEIPLSWVQRAFQALLATLNPLKGKRGQGTEESEIPLSDSSSSISTLICGAAGLEMAALREALSELAGAIVSRPAAWPDSYDFNVREAILGAGLVERPEQIVVVEEAIATLLSAIPGGGGETLALPSSLSQKLNLFNADERGLTLVISAGAATTELALVNLPDNLEHLTHSHFTCRSYPYAGNGIDQDILCQLLFNEQWRRKNQEFFLHYPFSLIDFEELPRPGEPDLERRYRLGQLLREVPRELGLIEAVQYLKISLQSQERLSLEIGKNRWACSRRDLESLVFVPFVQRLNRELNALLSQTGGLVQGINQAICTGPTASLGAIARWLRQKLPNARIIQDTYPLDCPPASSRVAYGLAAVPFHASIFDVHRQQYSDYFLLLELLRAVKSKPLSVAEILRLLERRGLNTSAIKQRILDLLEGKFPPGLALSETEALLLTSEFKENPDFLGLHAIPLFSKQDDGVYCPNPQQFQRLRSYASQLLARTYQQLEEPVMVELGYKARK